MPSIVEGRHLIAVVDADPARRHELRLWIQRLGFDLAVVEGASGADAVWLRFDYGPVPALTVLGRGTPGAFWACSEIRLREAREGRSHTRIVLWGWGPDDGPPPFSLMADGHLDRPIEPDQLLALFCLLLGPPRWPIRR